MPYKPNVRGEIRGAPRAVCAIPAIIVDRGVSLACTVEDLSINGCRVRMNGHGRLSDRFAFEFPRRGIKVDAELVWLNGEEAGIRFLHKGAAPGTGGDEPSRSDPEVA
ncbi:PilZ domain-containing protein [Stappia sp.]|uniref:PilZ domain-containing protein n=1 Tax=Stappia sp. TaxID=1870903 RepID=UPI003D14F567